ncbi:ATP-binding protein [Streptomyces sp. NPDC058284]|uniref:wHTH domain-containing protein n=1 Tax=unclassified Streptomyces TaxID=2593676 RepID=UPI00364D3184
MRGETWNSVRDSTVGHLVQAHTVVFQGARPDDDLSPSPSPAPVTGPWVDLAVNSTVWHHVSGRRDAGLFQQYVADVVAVQDRTRDATRDDAGADPWQDDDAVRRFVEALEWLLGEPDAARELDLYPAEAALLVLVPFLHRMQCLRLTATLAPAVEPNRLRPSHHGPNPLGRTAAANPARSAFEAFADSHDLLAERGRRHPDAEGPIGWWLFHRWLAEREEMSDPAVVGGFLRDIGEPAEALGQVLDPHRVARLLHGLRVGPGVCDPEHLGALPVDDVVRARRGGPQRVRDQRLALLLALAHGMSREITALPSIVVEHVGIPFPVDPAEVRQTLAASRWGGSPELPVLVARCGHEAVVEGLRGYVAHVDGLLATVRNTVHERVNQPLPPLPARLSADGVRPAEDVFSGWAAFRFDERRVREHFTGIQLYKEPELAVRELYQNALDACRHRRARTQYLDRSGRSGPSGGASGAYEGRIAMEQGTDAEGREYVECRDNGVGMGEQQLRGVFSEGGSQFVRERHFTAERARWAQVRPPVEFHPNSRFGIGVLSYFMLADEIRVRTCRMDSEGRLGPLLEARICGPAHLFRIVRLRDRGDEAGTQVRLYLRRRQAERAWSCVDALERVLGIAEFPTEAVHGSRLARWEEHRLKTRKAPAREQYGMDAHGALVPWRQAPEGVQLIWCEHGGGILVDGLVVQPEVRRGVLSSDACGLTGAVVNLTGARSPRQLSADRRTLLDDVAGQLGAVLEQAASALVAEDGPLPDYAWLCRVADRSMLLGDLLTTAAADAGRHLAFGNRTLDVARAGCFMADPKVVPELFGERRGEDRWRPDPWKSPHGHAPDAVLLWRLLAHRPNPLLAQLEEACPDLAEVTSVLPALPSDRDLLTAAAGDDDDLYWGWSSDVEFIVNHLHDTSEATGKALPDLVCRARQLGALPDRRTATFDELMRESHGPSPDVRALADQWRECGIRVPEAYVGLAAAAQHDPVLRRDLGEKADAYGWVDPDEAVPAGHIAKAALCLGLPVSGVCARLTACGLRVDAAGLPERPGADVAVLLSRDANSVWPWLDRSKEVPPGHVLAAARVLRCSPHEIKHRLEGLGFVPPSVWPEDASADDAAVLVAKRYGPLFPDEPVLYTHVFAAAKHQDWPLRRAVDRLRAYGFDVPLRPPRRFDALDGQLLCVDMEDRPLIWTNVTTADAMPFAHVMAAARDLPAPYSASILVERLTGYGVAVSCPDVPQGLSYARALDLLRIIDDSDMFLTIDCEIDLHDLLEKAEALKAPVAQVARWLQELGLGVPDLARLLREAAVRVPRPLGGE